MVKTLPVRSIIDAVASAAASWCDPCFEPRRAALEAVADRTGYSRTVVAVAFERLFGSLTGDGISSVISEELGSLDVLDGFVERGAGCTARALPIGRVCIISSRTTIGVALVPAIFALCAKCEVLVKDREDHLVSAFFATLFERLAPLGEVAAARSWRGASDDMKLDGFEAIVAYGNDRTLAEIYGALSLPVRFIAYPSKISAGYLTKESLTNEAAAKRLALAAAHDVLLYDGEGCLSLRELFVERGGNVTPAQFSQMLHGAMDATARELPLTSSGLLSSQLAAARDLATFRGTNLLSDAAATYLVLLDPPLAQPPLALPRTLSVHSLAEPANVHDYLARHGLALEALAVAAPDRRLRDLAERLGAAQLARFGSLQRPTLSARHGGRPRIAEFVRWIVERT